MTIFLLFFFGQSQILYYNATATDEQKCGDSTGCNYITLNSSINIGDTVQILSKTIENEDAKNFINVVNASLHKNLTIIGNNTIISNPGYEPSENAAFHVQNATICLRSLSFKNFLIPILNGLNCTYFVSDCSFGNSKCTVSALLAFVNSNVEFNNTLINDNEANTQSLFVGVNSTVSFNNMNASTNFLESRDIRAAFHFLGSNITFNNSTFFSNTLKLPICASSNSSNIFFFDSFFEFNSAYCVIALEYNASSIFDNVYFKSNRAAIAAGGMESIFNFTNCQVHDQESEEMLIGLSETDILVQNCSFINSVLASLAFHNLISNFSKKLTFIDVNISHVKSKISLFTAVGGEVLLRNVQIMNIKSDAEIIAYTQQGDGNTIIENSNFELLASTSKVATALSVMNTTSIKLMNVTITQNQVCGALFENSTVYVENSNFSYNQCLPQGNSLPLAILTNSLADNVTIKNSHFLNNTALTGSVFFMNTTSILENLVFSGNQAVQGAAVFAAGMNIIARNVNFTDNNAMAQGGAISLTEGNALFENCNFLRNSSPDGGVAIIRDAYNITFRKAMVKRNNSTNSSFINSEGPKVFITLEDTDVDDSPEKALFLDDHNHIAFKNARFNCKVRCQSVEKLPPKSNAHNNNNKNNNMNVNKNNNNKNMEKEKNMENEIDEDIEIENPLNEPGDDMSFTILWIIFIPLAFMIAAVLYCRLGHRGLKRFFNSLFKKNKYDL
ncbi:hypothetical protein TRFO_03451 [Tritrichomonas foetus]|uniref:Right handed beta helix domain-containing protein n=1 Tax=Tritrichomonas foetus TaxID=1144522 RepID=A0A1J4KU67_9EUKA|nr:hypothetical protein TRFO_03451 [Tritrichomonas foetus]|eukprot:OHT13037.1 hypothetical protein TRFO_03451 [Tritrichomonas foetus]